MTTTETTDFALRAADVLRPLGITRNMRAYRILRDALARIYEQEDRLEAVQKGKYMSHCQNNITATGQPFRARFVEPHRSHGTQARNMCNSWQATH